MSADTEPQWRATADAKRESIASRIPEHWRIRKVPDADELRDAQYYARGFLSAREIQITEIGDARELLQKIESGQYTAVEVAEAFCHRAAIAHQTVNCLSEIVFDQALERAKELDDYYQIHKKPIGPLHGLPVSLKDQFRVKDTHTSVGFVAWLDKTETEETESFLVTELRNAGAIIYVKTNVPTSLMAIETNNNIIGYTWNPRNRHLSSGGSSGGEAALIAMGGSIVGLGSDIGASIRLPAAVCGIYGLKPSHGRLPYLGVRLSMEGHDTAPSVIGPMGSTLSNLTFLMGAMLHMQPWLHDPKVIELPWRPEQFDAVHGHARSGGLCFGLLRFDGMVMPHPPVLRAMDELRAKLEAQGHEVIEWTPPPHSEAFQLIWDMFATDGGNEIHDTLAESGEKPVPQLSASFGETKGTLPAFSVSQVWALNRRVADYRTRYAQYWNSTASLTKSRRPVDAVLLPVAPSASFRPGEGVYFGYTGVAVALDYSVVTVPVTTADKDKDADLRDYEPRNDIDRLIGSHYEPETFHGAPVGVQIMARRLQEEKVLAVAEVVEKALHA
ncbi:hypothetical protein AcW1_002093 [Taiwanofungus camphoratus]|nr:hypothetical protein AcW1_002093 [Antrodia cinnamomea]KAI0946004.1 hypothetical protein AcV7_010098 [Antrodia cinnamomea]